MWGFYFYFSECGEIWERQGETEETREGKANWRRFWKSLGVSDGGDSAFRDVGEDSVFTEQRQLPEMHRMAGIFRGQSREGDS